MARLTLAVFGSFQVLLDNTPITAFESDKVRALLAYLAVEAERPHQRATLAGLLWPGASESAARRNLSQALFNLRQVIDDYAADPPFLRITRETIQFNADSDYALDVATFRALSSECGHGRQRSLGPHCVQELERAVTLYRESFLQQFFLSDSAAFEEWVLVHREELHQRALSALNALTDYYIGQQDYEAALRHARRQLALEPCREEAHRQAMRALALSGERTAALAQYETCRRVLVDELGAEPSPETQALYEQIRGEKLAPTKESVETSRSVTVEVEVEVEVEVGSAIPSTQHVPAFSFSLPSQLTPFVGRERELAEIGQLLANPEARLVTLIGPGGMGKTRLAIQAAAAHREDFAHGVAFVPLASAESTELIVPAIAGALHFAFSGPLDAKTQLLNFLRDKHVLLVIDNIDNFEHVMDGVDVLIEILEHAPQVRLLVTCREPLDVQGEWLFEVGGLPVEGLDALTLFVHRARRARVGFAVSADDYPAITRICQFVGGMPLGIELAATWVRTLSCAEIAAEIERDIHFLATTARDVPERHRSITAVFDYSWDLLSQEEHRAMRQLAVFRGGFRRDAAERVAGASLALLSTLVTKSLVRRTPSGAQSGRYDLHELVRHYVAAKLSESPAEANAARDRHSAYYLAFLREKRDLLRSADQPETLKEFTTDADNVRAAWDWAVKTRNIIEIQRSARSLLDLYDWQCWYQEGEQVFKRAIEQLEANFDPQQKAGMLDRAHAVALGYAFMGYGMLGFRIGHYNQVQQLLQRSLALFRVADDATAMADNLYWLGFLNNRFGNYAEARLMLEESAALYEKTGDPWGQAVALIFNGVVVQQLGDFEEARALSQQALDLFKATGDPAMSATSQARVGLLLAKQGKHGQAKALLQDSLAISRAVDDRWSLATSLYCLGQVAYDLGNYAEAKRLQSESLAIFKDVGEYGNMTLVMNDLGQTAIALGHDDEARDLFREVLRLTREAQLVSRTLDALAGFARVEAHEGEIEKALELALFVIAHSATSYEARKRAEQLQAELAAQLSHEHVEAAQARAAERTLETVIEDILAQPVRLRPPIAHPPTQRSPGHREWASYQDSG